MAEITTQFWDIGGVILTNGWDHNSRRAAVEKFQLDEEEFRERHDLSFPAFDAGMISLEEYLDRTIFYGPRAFSRDEFKTFMYAQSIEYGEARRVLDSLTQSGKYFIGAINNEPRELNEYRVQKFALRRNFQVFFTSCYVHARKPEELIYRFALSVTQRAPENCLFVDDRPINLDAPRRLGMNTIHYQNAEQLRGELRKYGIAV